MILGRRLVYTLLLLGSGAIGSLAKTSPIIIKGNAFFDSESGERFYLRGVDYQPGGSSSLVDPLATDSCLRDVEIFKKMGVNTIRVYQVDNAADHDNCMKAFEEAGIYVILDLNTFRHSISRADPAISYNKVYLQHVFSTVDAFKDYDNVLGFFSGNEVVNDHETTAITWVKATTRDVKAYIKKHASRQIPVGYSAADIAENRLELAHYFNCGNEDERADFYAFNMYEWCGHSSMSVSGYFDRIREFSSYSIPLFLSEFGCNTVEIFEDQTPDRPFTEIEAIYSPQMTESFSGGLVYEYSAEPNNYGLVIIDDNENRKISKNCVTLMKQFQKVPNPKGDGGYRENSSPSECPRNSTYFQAWDVLPPMPKEAKVYLEEGAGEPLGIDGPTNMWSPYHQHDGNEYTAPKRPKVKPASNATNSSKANLPDKDEQEEEESASSRVTFTLVQLSLVLLVSMFIKF